MKRMSGPVPWEKVFSVGTNVLLAIAGAACLLKGVLSLWNNDEAAATALGLTAGLVLLLASSIERFEVLKGLGMEARIRELKQTVSDANATLVQLRELATSLCHASISDLMASNFMGSMSLKRKVELHDDLIGTLKKLGADSAQVAQADQNWRKGMGVLYHNIVHHHLARRKQRNHVNSDVPPEAKAAAEDFAKLLAFEEWRAPSPDTMETFIESRGQMSTVLQEWIDDYRHYLEHGKIRRPELFFKE